MMIDKEEFENSGYAAELEKCKRQNYLEIAGALHQCAKKNENNKALAAFLDLLAQACRMMLEPQSANMPFKPCIVWADGWRSIAIDDFSQDFIDTIAAFYPDIENARLRARLADIVWLRKKDHKAVLAALNAYLESGIKLENWCSGDNDCAERAIILCKQLNQKEKLTEIEENLVSLILLADSEAKKFPGTMCGPAEVLFRHNLAKEHYAELAAFFEQMATEGEEYYSQFYFEVAAEFYRKIIKIVKYYEMCFLRGRIFEIGAGNNFMEKGYFYGKTIHEYQKIPKNERLNIFTAHGLSSGHIESLRREITRSSQEAFSNPEAYGMRMHSINLDISKEINLIEAKVKGKNFNQALFTLTNLFPWIIESELGRISAGSIVSHIASTSTFTSDGRSVNSPEFAIMQAYKYRLNLGATLIAAALRIIKSEHGAKTEADFLSFARQSPVVPRDREELVAKALFYGYQGDFTAALYLLTPQIENIVRFHLNRIGVITTTRDAQGNEAEIGLSSLLEKPECKTAFDADIVFELNMLFCKNDGPNLRNETAHGLRNDAQSCDASAVYAWWILLKLVFSWICEGQVRGLNPYFALAHENQTDKT